MNFHTCKNCCLIDKIIENQIEKYKILSKENMDIHTTLIKSKEIIIQMESEILNLRDGLIAERQNNLRRHLQQHFKELQQESQALIINSEPEKPHGANKKCKGLIPVRVRDEINYISLSNCDQIRKLGEKQKEMYKDDLDLLQFLSNKCNANLKLKLKEIDYHMSLICDICEKLENDFVKEKNQAMDCHELLDNTIKTIKLQQTKQLFDLENEMMADTKKAANAKIKETINIMKLQLADRDKLIAKLRQQQVKMEAYVEKNEQELHKQEQNHEQAIIGLHERLLQSENKFKMLEIRHSLEGQGFNTDITNFCKEIKQIKYKLCAADCEIFVEIQKLEEHIDKIDGKIKLSYCR